VLVVGRLQRGRHGGGGGAGRGSGFWGGLGFHGRCRGQRGGEGRSKDRGRGVVASWRWEMMARWEKGRKTATEAGCVCATVRERDAVLLFFFWLGDTENARGPRRRKRGRNAGNGWKWKAGSRPWVGVGIRSRILFR
jgi:hypothetical protein